MSKPIAIHVVPNGPLKVSCDQAIAVTFKDAVLPSEAGQDLYLCRCGQSKNAPYCDGTHSKVGFDGSPSEQKPREAKLWQGRTIQTRFDRGLCMHIYTCKPLGDLRAAELAGDDAAAQTIADVVQRCPSGALQFSADTASAAEPTGPALIIREGAEIQVKGNFEINHPLRSGQPTTRATLCRCGLSKNKPYCDGRHTQAKDFS